MRTTIDLPDQLFRRVKATTALRGSSLKRFVTDAIQHELERTNQPSVAKRVRLPLVKSKNPGGVTLDAERAADLLDDEDVNGSS